MKILYVPSGLKLIYKYFDEWITKAFITNGYPYRIFDQYKKISTLNTIIKNFQPDLILTMVGFHYPKKLLKFLNQIDIPTAVWLTEDPYYMNKTASIISYFDFIFTIESQVIEKYKQLGYQHVYHLPLGTDPETFKSTSFNQRYESDMCLIGYPYYNRVKYINFLLQHTTCKVQVIGSHWKRHLNDHTNLIIKNNWINPYQVNKYFNGAKIVLNIHRPFDEEHNQNNYPIIAQSINNRTFDIASSGSFQMIDHRLDLPHYFDEGKEIISFKNEQELLDKVDYYLKHEDERTTIAERSKEKAIHHHTFSNRIETMMEIINNHIPH